MAPLQQENKEEKGRLGALKYESDCKDNSKLILSDSAYRRMQLAWVFFSQCWNKERNDAHVFWSKEKKRKDATELGSFSHNVKIKKEMMLTFSEVRKKKKEDATELRSMRVRTCDPGLDT
jgi:hypothetical protein